MTKLWLLCIIMLFSSNVFAESHAGVSPILKFSLKAEKFANQVGTRYIKFVPEDVTFPAGAQKVKFEKALSIMEEVINSEEFKIKVIGYERAGVRSYEKNYLWSNKNERLSNEDIYEVIMNGDEKMRAGTPGEMNFNSWVKKCSKLQMITDYFWCKEVIGSTTPESSYLIKLNWAFYDEFETHDMVANMVHEWIHLLGFLHGKERLREEVPYVVGKIAGEVAENMLAIGL